jgi:hypothetical protein
MARRANAAKFSLPWNDRIMAGQNFKALHANTFGCHKRFDGRLPKLPSFKAERIVGEELKRMGWQKDELSRWRKSDPGKLAIASRLRRETTLTMGQVAAQLQMGCWKSLKAKLNVWRKANEK